MLDTFYLTATESYSGTWYMLLVKDSHFCLACGGDLDKITKVLRHYVKTYRTRERLFRSLSGLDSQGKVSESTFLQREEYYRKHGEDYEDLITQVVLEAQSEAREEDKLNSPLNKARTRLRKAGGVKSTTQIKEESITKDFTIPDSPTILRKPRVFNRK